MLRMNIYKNKKSPIEVTALEIEMDVNDENP
jgi:hypothetical protein